MPAAPIVLAVSTSRTGDEPIALAADLARATGTPIHAVATFDTSPWSVGMGSVYVDALRDAASAALDQALAALADLGVTGELRAGGSLALALHQAAAQAGAGLIVAGSSRRGALGRLTLGGTTESMLHGSPCPVAVAPRGYEGGHSFRHVAVALADTPEGHEALRGGLALAAVLDGGTVHAFTLVDPIDWVGDHIPFDADAALRDAVRQAEAGLAAAVEHATVPVTIEAVTGHVEPALLELGQAADLLVSGSRGHGPVRETLLGSASRRLVRSATCPVIVIPRGTERPFEALLAHLPAGTAAG